jgi:hypothetical protein
VDRGAAQALPVRRSHLGRRADPVPGGARVRARLDRVHRARAPEAPEARGQGTHGRHVRGARRVALAHRVHRVRLDRAAPGVRLVGPPLAARDVPARAARRGRRGRRTARRVHLGVPLPVPVDRVQGAQSAPHGLPRDRLRPRDAEDQVAPREKAHGMTRDRAGRRRDRQVLPAARDPGVQAGHRRAPADRRRAVGQQVLPHTRGVARDGRRRLAGPVVRAHHVRLGRGPRRMAGPGTGGARNGPCAATDDLRTRRRDRQGRRIARAVPPVRTAEVERDRRRDHVRSRCRRHGAAWRERAPA